ncbi:polysaccharide lyase family 8 super-sandwich domain-containing protein [Nonomuraea turcica]|uniref:polysaccharide lyase family 8 super-sandwich domain-containing protein n=1 Tax=Nonomuraea sp. G32 TaxID=3067274 RepID=UPI00273B995E|nr:polysaccharide lyase family 8 super-sandwich domain-containing protein [Nonomuraea sp. G32]MDP4503790.1 polysaccharide lyase family 8 super-sandwich domain-containing protein [Nonomuraea sp. G32]
MEAFKSWFFLDDAVVCLGAGITSADGARVETIVDNRRTGAPLAVEPGWAHLEGHGGYLVPGSLRTLRERRGTRDYVTLWLDHGVDPRSAGYAYTLLPGASRSETRARAADPGWLRVMANSARLQAVHVPSLRLTAANFWNAGAAGDLTASAPCAVLAREHGDGTATLSVADPRCDLDELTVTWARPVAGLLSVDGRARTGLRWLRKLPLSAPGSPLSGDALLHGSTLTFHGLAEREGAPITVTVRLSL